MVNTVAVIVNRDYIINSMGDFTVNPELCNSFICRQVLDFGNASKHLSTDIDIVAAS